MIPIANFEQHAHKFLETDLRTVSSFLPLLLLLLITALGLLFFL
jgi:hypothetical protein